MNKTKPYPKTNCIKRFVCPQKLNTILVKQVIEITLQENLWFIILCIGQFV